MNRKLVWLGLGLALVALAPDRERAPEVGKSYRIPYRRTDTNHVLVRVRINHKGPFNFLVDTGAPFLYIGTEAARKIGLETGPGEYWTPVDRIDFEGGANLQGMKARVEDPFQLVGMNALGLPGATIDGILGFLPLSRFRIELDPTQDRMTWTRLDFEPREPFVPRGGARQAPAEVQAMNALGPLAKFMALLVGKQPPERLHPRGFLGLELADDEGTVRVAGVLPDSPADRAGIQADDRLVRVLGREVEDLVSAHEAIAKVQSGDQVALELRRGDETLERTVTAGEGF